MDLDARGYVPKNEVYRRLAEELALRDVSAPELESYFFAHYHRHCVPFPGLIEMLGDLHAQDVWLSHTAHYECMLWSPGIGSSGAGKEAPRLCRRSSIALISLC
jgi:phosphoglycolate phosphatase-like HAD superfamily hydrolase